MDRENPKALNRKGIECGLAQRLTSKSGGLTYFESHFNLHSKEGLAEWFYLQQPFQEGTRHHSAFTVIGVFKKLGRMHEIRMHELQAQTPFQVAWLTLKVTSLHRLESKEGLNGLICKNPFDLSLHLSGPPLSNAQYFNLIHYIVIFL